MRKAAFGLRLACARFGQRVETTKIWAFHAKPLPEVGRVSTFLGTPIHGNGPVYLDSLDLTRGKSSLVNY